MAQAGTWRTTEEIKETTEKNIVPEACSTYPQVYWGLDPMTHTYCKLYICDVLTIPEYPSSTPVSGVFAYKNHPVNKVDLLGVIVRVEHKSKLSIYAIDDGTGVINCCCWKPDPLTVKNCLIPGLQEKVTETEGIHQAKEQGFNLGDLLHVRGKVKVFREQREISASYFAIVKDPNAELNRMLEVPKLYQSFYDKAFQLANIVKRRHTEDFSLVLLAANLQETLQNFFEESRIEHFCMADIETSDDIKALVEQCASDQNADIDKRALLDEVIKQLEEIGFLVKYKGHKEDYRVITNDVRMHQTVLDLLRQECAKPKHAEKGRHYLHILGLLKNTSEYRCINANAVLKCLQRLEEDSQVISTTDKHFVSLE